MQLRLPLMRLIVRANAFAHFSRTLGALLVNGVPVLEALSIVEDTVGNRVIAEEIHEARDRVTDGSSISGPLAAGNIFPPLLTDMLAVGEESGDMSGALRHIAKRYDDELDRTVKILTTVLEPILMLVMALLVGFVAISILLAVFDLTSGLNV
jgi:type II secretory pathway component PulF